VVVIMIVIVIVLKENLHRKKSVDCVCQIVFGMTLTADSWLEKNKK
jgi:hypothetical protein